MNDQQRQLETQFRREARIGSAVIVVALIGFLAVAYLRITGRLDRDRIIGQIPPPTPNFELLSADKQIAQLESTPKSQPDVAAAPAAARASQTRPSADNRPPNGTGTSEPLANSRTLEFANAAESNVVEPVPPYDILSQLRGDSATTAANSPARSPQASPPVPAPLPPILVPRQLPESTSLAGERTAELARPPHLRLPSGPATLPTPLFQNLTPKRASRTLPGSTATLPYGNGQGRVNLLVDSAVAPVCFEEQTTAETKTQAQATCPVPDFNPLDREMPLRDQRMYLTTAGDTLFSIAAETLGQASRFVELLELNRAILPPGAGSSTRLPAGLPLHLPERQ